MKGGTDAEFCSRRERWKPSRWCGQIIGKVGPLHSPVTTTAPCANPTVGIVSNRNNYNERSSKECPTYTGRLFATVELSGRQDRLQKSQITNPTPCPVMPTVSTTPAVVGGSQMLNALWEVLTRHSTAL